MKFKYFVAMATAALVMTNCSKEESLVNEESAGLNQIIATVEGKEARSTTNDAGVFKWSEGDQLKVIDNSNGKSYYQYGDNGKFSLISGQGIIGSSMYAAYPANVETSDFDVKFDITDDQNGVRSIEYPSVLGSTSEEYKENTNAMMLAKVDPTNLSVLNFKHLGGVMRFTIQDVPTGCKYFEFTATDKRINGKFKLSSLQKDNDEGDLKTTTDGVYYVETVSASDGTIFRRNFKATTSAQTMTFYVPLPVGEYSDFEIKLGFNGDPTSITKSYSGSTKKINRRTLMMMSTLKVENNSLVSATTDNSTEVTLLEEDQQLSVNGSGETITVNVPDETDATAKLNLNFTPTDENSTLAISDGSADNATPTDSKATVNVDAGTATVGTLNIDAPTLTVNLEKGTFTSVTAKTALQTLVIKSGVQVGTLILKGGNVVIEGTVTTIQDENDKEYTLVKTLEELNNAISNGNNIILGADIESSSIIVIGKALTLNGNGYKLTSSAGRAINISGTDGVTIKNLEIDASGERAINIIQNSTNVTIDNVIATATHYTVNIASSAPGAKVDIKNSNLTGLNVVNVASAGANVTVDHTTLNCEDQNSYEGYSVICLNKDATNGTITATNVTIVISGDFNVDTVQATNGADGGTITIDGSTENVDIDVAFIPYGDNYYGFTTIEKALEKAKTGEYVSLIRDIDLDESIVITKEANVNLNGKSIKCASSDVFVVNAGTLTIEGEGLVYGSEGNEGNSCAVWVNGSTAKAIIKGGTYKVGGDINGTTDQRNDCIYVGKDGGTIEIYGGEFKYTGTVNDGTINDGHRFLINQNNALVERLITVYGGTFHNFDPSNAKTDEPWMTNGVGSFVADGYSSTTSDNGATYVVAQIGGN